MVLQLSGDCIPFLRRRDNEIMSIQDIALAALRIAREFAA